MALTTESAPEAPYGHVVQFYDRDEELVAGVGPYLAEAIRAGGAVIVIATEAHRQAFAAQLAHAGLASERAGASLVMLDAREAADALLIDGRIAPHRFDKLIGDLVRKTAADGRPLRAYGEIVALLWADGHVRAAIELEDLWNALGREVDFSLYCAYPRAWVEGEEEEAVDAVCGQHSAVFGRPPARQPAQTLPIELESMFRWSGRSPTQARHFVIDSLTAWGCGAPLDDAAVIATELATNAVLHARTEFTVVVSRRREGRVRIAVRDASLVRPRPRPAGPLESSGRGLRLVEALAADWGADFLPDGKVIWAELRAVTPR